MHPQFGGLLRITSTSFCWLPHRRRHAKRPLYARRGRAKHPHDVDPNDPLFGCTLSLSRLASSLPPGAQNLAEDERFTASFICVISLLLDAYALFSHWFIW
jgi:hypothetical protein